MLISAADEAFYYAASEVFYIPVWLQWVSLLNPASFIFEKMNENRRASAILAGSMCAIEDNQLLSA